MNAPFPVNEPFPVNATFPVDAPCLTIADFGDQQEIAEIEAFVAEQGGSLFHRPLWLRSVAAGTGHEAAGIVARSCGRLTGWLPLTIVHSPLFGRALISSGFAVDGGPLADSGAIARELCSTAQAYAARFSCRTIEVRGGCVPSDWAQTSSSHCGFVRPLADTADAQLLDIPRKQRAEIRKSLKQIFEVTVGSAAEDREAHYAVYTRSVHNLGTPVFPRSLFDAVLDGFAGEADILTVRHDGEPVASVMSFYHDGTVLPYWGGGVFAARKLRANERMYYELMCHARRRGMSRFDFGRSKTGSGPYHYKRNWGFDPLPLTYGSWTAPHAKPRDLSPANESYAAKIALWKKLPLAVANRLGPFIARDLA